MIKQVLLTLTILYTILQYSYGITGDYISINKPNFVCLLEIDMVKNNEKLNYVCSSSLIDSSTLLTAGHCNYKEFFGENATDQISFRVKCPNSPEINVDNLKGHEDSDLMIINLRTPLKTINNFPSFPVDQSQESEIVEKGVCSVWGYGLDNNQEFRNLNGALVEIETSSRTRFRGKRKPRQRIVSVSKRQGVNSINANLFGQSLQRQTRGNFTIALNKNNTKVNPGDSGGPVLCRYKNKWFLLGVSSFGNDSFDIAQSVNQYLKWIEDNNREYRELKVCE